MMNIKVLGPGCGNCKRLLEVTKDALKELNKEAELEYITDIGVMVSYGIMGSPALMINDKVVSQGRIISKDDVIKLINNNEVIAPKASSCGCGGNC
jgi:small redox-active disulfide protein 2